MKWFKQNDAEIILGLGLIFFLGTYFGEGYRFSIPLVVIGALMLYRRHTRNAAFFVPDDTDIDAELYERAKQVVISTQKASTSLIQRKLNIGYSRSARLMNMLEENGVVGPADGENPRKIYEQKSEGK